MGKEGRMETTGDQGTSRVLKVLDTSREVTRDSRRTRKDRDNIEMIGLSKDLEMEVIEDSS